MKSILYWIGGGVVSLILLANIFGGTTPTPANSQNPANPPAVQTPAPTLTPEAPKAEPVPTPAPKPAPRATPKPSCDPNYSGACVPIASDVDCLGGSGNGPAYVKGPVYVVGKDIYGLDRDGNGVGCEN